MKKQFLDELYQQKFIHQQELTRLRGVKDFQADSHEHHVHAAKKEAARSMVDMLDGLIEVYIRMHKV